MDVELMEKYNNLFHRRQAADYNLDSAFRKEDAEQAISFAKDFYQFTKNYFNP